MDNNQQALRKTIFSLKRKNCRLAFENRELDEKLKKIEMHPVKKFFFNELENLGEIPCGISFISLTSSAIFKLLSCTKGLVTLANKGYSNSDELLAEIEKFYASVSSIVDISFDAFLISFISFGAISVSSNIINDQTVGKIKMQKYVNEINQDRNKAIILMMEDLKNSPSDPSLNFIHTFFNQVDLSVNTKEFNLELLRLLSIYRDRVLELQNGECSQKEVELSFLNFTNFLRDSQFKNEAALSFVQDPYIMKLIQYSEEIEKEENRSRSEKSR